MTTEKKPSAWDAEKVDKLQYGQHEFRLIDPTAVNMEDFAKDLYEGQEHYGDVREYNAAKNSKHPENDLTLDWASRPGTVFTTKAEGLEGKYLVTDIPTTKAGKILIRAVADFRVLETDRLSTQLVELDAALLGIVTDETNNFKQVVSKLIARGTVNRKITKGLPEKEGT